MKNNLSCAGPINNKNLYENLPANFFCNCLNPYSKGNQFRKQLDCKNPDLSLQLAKRLNIIVDKSYFLEEMNAVSFKLNGYFIIGVNILLERDETNFVIAHEIGHIVLHSKTISINLKKDHDLNRSKFSALDTEANEFACALLIPQDILNDKLKTHNFSEIAKHFNVPKQAISYTLKLAK